VNIASLIDAPSTQDPDRTALILKDGNVTYGELAAAARSVAHGLRAAGVQRGDRVPVVEVGNLLSIATMLGAARIGAAAALMNPALRPQEIAALIETAGCVKMAVTGPAFADMVSPAVDGHVLGPAELLHNAVDPAEDEVVGSDEDDGLILFTSGTTGLPKAIPISHGVISRRFMSYAPTFKPENKANVGMMSVPFFHVGGSLGQLTGLYGANTSVVQERFEAGQWLELVERHRVVSTFLVPTMLQRILDHPNFATTDLSSLAVVAYGAAAAPKELVLRALEALPQVAFANIFGQTETLGAYTTLAPGDHRNVDLIGSVGKALPGVEIRVVVPGTEDSVPAGEVGELVVLSDQNVQPGWFHTGDLARIDAEGYIFPSGRLSDTINRGGEKFGPIEIETVLRDHPAIVEVAVVAVPDAEMGERVGALIVSNEPLTDDQVRTFCADRLARFKLPERIVFADEIPYNDTGKVDRRSVVALLSQSSA
jgi:acyl-CoA synthetase (AMP-forming)/AMP-acid ligase II